MNFIFLFTYIYNLVTYFFIKIITKFQALKYNVLATYQEEVMLAVQGAPVIAICSIYALSATFKVKSI